MTPLTMVLAEQTGSETIAYLHGLDLVAQSDGVTTEYFAYDGLGSVRQVADEAGDVLLTQTFDPYGSLYARAGEDVTSFGFTGEYGDSNGLLYLRARYYAPSQGRFFQLDPSRLEVNSYAYVAGNPLNRVDPSGLCWNNPNASPGERAICIAAWEQRYGPSSNYGAQYWGILSYQDFKLRWNRGVGTGSAGTSTAWMSALATCAYVEPTYFGEVIVGLSMITLWLVEHTVPLPDITFDFPAAERQHGVREVPRYGEADLAQHRTDWIEAVRGSQPQPQPSPQPTPGRSPVPVPLPTPSDCDQLLAGGRHPNIPTVSYERLIQCRPEVVPTIVLIHSNGPFPSYPSRQGDRLLDDGVFYNDSGYLPPPSEPRGGRPTGYREYTVPPGVQPRGGKRIITYGTVDRQPSGYTVMYYTEDHYQHFVRVD